MLVAYLTKYFSENSAISKETCNLKLPSPTLRNVVLHDAVTMNQTRQLRVSVSSSYPFSCSFILLEASVTRILTSALFSYASPDCWIMILLLVVTTLAQRLAQPEFQTELVSDLFPAHKHLMIKRSQRCRSCEHNVSKPEYNPGSIKFKIQLAA